jgi:hypothetical protein
VQSVRCLPGQWKQAMLTKVCAKFKRRPKRRSGRCQAQAPKAVNDWRASNLRALERQSSSFLTCTFDFESSIAQTSFLVSYIMNSTILARMQPIMRQPLMRLQAMKQPLQRQPFLRTSRPFHGTRTTLRVKASLRSIAYHLLRLTVSL